MCGIAGLISPVASLDPRIIEHFQKKLSHRGPDDEGLFEKIAPPESHEASVVLFHRRLSIVDLSHGHQPFIAHLAPNRQLALSVNGEIYNFKELRTYYSSYPFQTASDCEVIIPLYLDKGPLFLSHLQGMFAVALYDSDPDHLILARDVFGMKPLYIRKLDQCLTFASEIPPLTFPFLENPLNPQSQSEALHRQYTSKTGTLFQDMTRVLPGQTLIINAELQIQSSIISPVTGQAPQKKSMFFTKATPSRPPILKEFETLLLETLDAHLLSDVPIGLFYSGGVDSSVLLRALNLLGHKTIPAFHIYFDKEPPNLQKNSPLKAHFHELPFTEEDFWNLLPLGAFVMDDFAADYAVLPTLKLAQAAKNHNIPVILSGEGGDEVFAGYGRYRPRVSIFSWRFSLFRHKSLLYNLPLASHLSWYQRLLKEEKEIFKKPLSSLQKAQYMDMTTWVPDDLMIKLDRTLMHYGLEGRPPFLDKNLAQFGFQLPDAFKIKNNHGKWLLKQWLSAQVPSLNFFVKKKGFSPPVHRWLFQKIDFLKKTLPHQEALSPVIPPHHTDHLLHRLSYNPDNKKAGLALWILLFYTLWYKIHVQGYSFHETVFDLLEKP